MLFDPTSISQGELHARREAAQRAWDNDTRHPLIDHPNPAFGQCYVTSRWLQKLYGGYVGRKEGHFFWLSPDLKFAIDLTGDKYHLPAIDESYHGVRIDEDDTGRELGEHHRAHLPGPIFYKKADHPLFKGWEIMPSEVEDEARVQRFIERAEHEFSNPSQRIALDYAGDAFPGEEPETRERLYHDEPNYIPPAQQEYNFVWGNGQLHVSPIHDHDELAEHAQISNEHDGPLAVGYVMVEQGNATWLVSSNVHAQGLYRILKDYTESVGWKWGGLTDIEGQPISDDFAPRVTYFYTQGGDGSVLLSKTRTNLAVLNTPAEAKEETRTNSANKSRRQPAGRQVHQKFRTTFSETRTSFTFSEPDIMMIKGGRLRVSKLNPNNYEAFAQFARDRGLELIGGNDNVIKRIEDLEENNLYSPDWVDEGAHFMFQDSPDQRQPGGVFKCPSCAQLFPNWHTYMEHRRQEEPRGDIPGEDGKFPELDIDATFPPHQSEPFALSYVHPVASVKEAMRVPGFEEIEDWSLSEPTYYVAYQRGAPIGYGAIDHGVVKALHSDAPGVEMQILSKMELHNEEVFSTEPRPGWTNVLKGLWKWSASTQPKDMVEAPIPFIYDIQEDDLFMGQPGTRTSDIPGKFTPGGIVEGVYEPGGKVVIRSLTNMPYTARHLLELWYYNLPHLEVTGIHLTDDEGKSTKLAQWEVGSYIRALVEADPTTSAAADALQKAGGRVFVVGGAVRDAILNRQPNDLDLMVSGLPKDRVEEILNELPGRVDLTGKSFGVYRYRNQGSDVEIALPRTERSTGGRRRDFEVQADHTLRPEEDLSRRDFTANAMAVDLSTGQLLDPHGGVEDLRNKILRAHNENALAEDPVRILRALTARSKHGLIPDEATREAMRQNAIGILQEPNERLQTELDKLLSGEDPAEAIRLAHETGVLKHILPEVDEAFGYDQNNPHHELDLGEHLLAVLDRAARITDDPDVRLAALLHDIGKPKSVWVDPQTGSNHYYFNRSTGEGANHEEVGADLAYQRLRDLKFPADRIQRVTDLVAAHMYGPFTSEKGARRFLNQHGDLADALVHLRDADQGGKGAANPGDIAAEDQRRLLEQIRQQNVPTERTQLAINGNDLIGIGMHPGPELGAVLERLTQAVVDDPSLNAREVLLDMAKRDVTAI